MTYMRTNRAQSCLQACLKCLAPKISHKCVDFNREVGIFGWYFYWIFRRETDKVSGIKEVWCLSKGRVPGMQKLDYISPNYAVKDITRKNPDLSFVLSITSTTPTQCCHIDFNKIQTWFYKEMKRKRIMTCTLQTYYNSNSECKTILSPSWTFIKQMVSQTLNTHCIASCHSLPFRVTKLLSLNENCCNDSAL